ncbi:MAG: hypothetical protein ABFS12_13545 [Bacteroidota bacterium]
MKRKTMLLLMFIVFLFLSNLVFSQEKDKRLTFATESGLGIQFSGEVELEYINVEGQGGFANKDLTFQKVKTRSPHIRIDKAIFAPTIFYGENLTYKIELGYNDTKALVDKHYARLKVPAINSLFELGKNRPMIKTDRLTEGYPLVGTAFWKGREYHLTAKSEFPISENFSLNGGLSAAMKRPLGTDDLAEDKSFKTIVYDDYDVKDGQTTEYGIMGGLEALGFYATGWYFMGELIDDFDWKIQLSQTLSDYDNLAAEVGKPVNDMTHYWYGGRVGFDRWGLRARAEYINGQDGVLPRDGWYVEGSYIMDVSNFLPINSITALARYDELYVRNILPRMGETESWDRQMATLALIADLNKYIFLKVEYYMLEEDMNTDENGLITNDEVLDDQLLIQLHFTF